MTKDVLLSIKGLQIGENEQNDTIEVISPGDYYFRNGKHCHSKHHPIRQPVI